MGIVFSTPGVLRSTVATIQVIMVLASSAEARRTVAVGGTYVDSSAKERRMSDGERDVRGRPPGRLESTVSNPSAFLRSRTPPRSQLGSRSKFFEGGQPQLQGRTLQPIHPRLAGPLTASSGAAAGAACMHSGGGLGKAPTTRMAMLSDSDVGGRKEEGDGRLAGVPGARPVRFMLLRHGQTNFNAEGRVQGSSDFSRLTEVGKQQARGVGEFLAKYEFASVYVSPLARAHQTLETAMERSVDQIPGVTVDSGLREIDLYEWEGMLKQDIKVEYPEMYAQWRGAGASQLRLPSGNMPVVQLWERAREVWGRILHEGPQEEGADRDQLPALVVAHNAIIQAMLCTAIGLSEDAFRRYQVPNCGVLEVEWVLGEPRARRWRWRYPADDTWRSPEEEVGAPMGTGGGQRTKSVPPPSLELPKQADAGANRALENLERPDSDSL